MSVEKAVSIADLRLLAKRRVPRVVFDILDGASEDEVVLGRSIERMRAYTLTPRVLRGVAERSQKTTLFGKTYPSFFGIAPMGTIGIIRRDIEFDLVEAASEAGIPMALSGSSAHSLEDVAAKSPGTLWSQLYAAKDPKITEDLVSRAKEVGAQALIWTVDLPVYAKIDRNIRNGIGIPARLSLASKLEALLHPVWISEYLRGGMARIGHWQKYAAHGASDEDVFKFYIAQKHSGQTWRELETLRRLWDGPLIVKGILHPDDARMAAQLGANGIIVSNHGGYGLDRSPASIDMLPKIVEAVGEQLTVMFDSGIRRGSDAVIARCLGAKFVFCGRAVLYGAAAGRKAGAAKAISILMDEIDRTLGLIGCPNHSDLGPSYTEGLIR